jgi:CheY-like chemotaxis protein
MLSARDPKEAAALIEREHPLAVIVNQPPDALQEAWLRPLDEQSDCYGVPVLRCSIPSPSWLQLASGLDDCLTKPVGRDTLQRVLARYARPSDLLLVVDDDPGFVSLMVRMLGTLAPETSARTAYSGPQAVRLAREHRPRLVFLDLLMPEMDGFAVLRELRADDALRDTIVVAVTATSYAEEILLRQGSHFTVTQSSGISPGALVELLNAALQVLRPDYVEATHQLGGDAILTR